MRKTCIVSGKNRIHDAIVSVNFSEGGTLLYIQPLVGLSVFDFQHLVSIPSITIIINSIHCFSKIDTYFSEREGFREGGGLFIAFIPHSLLVHSLCNIYKNAMKFSKAYEIAMKYISLLSEMFFHRAM